jgi:hypothetical protein
VAALRWGGDPTEGAAGLCAAAALARLTGGVTFDPAASVLRNPDEAIAAARSELDAVRRSQPPKQAIANPSSIKRLLKPILEMRRDLGSLTMLVGSCAMPTTP